MARPVPRALFLSLLMGLGFGLFDCPVSDTGSTASLLAGSTRPDAARVVFLAGNLSAEQIVALSAGMSAARHPGTLLLDSAKASPYLKHFLAQHGPERIIPVGSFPDGEGDLESRLGISPAPAIDWTTGNPLELWQSWFQQAEQVVVCPAEPYRQLLQAACLAGTLRAPLLVIRDSGQERELRRLVDVWRTRTVHAVGAVEPLCRKLGVKVIALRNESAVASSHRRELARRGPIRTVVLTNPADVCRDVPGMSPLAPWIALQRHAVLLLTGDTGEDAAAVVKSALTHKELAGVEHVILAADLQTIPMERRPNPIPDGKDPYIEMEPLTPTGTEPFSFAVGRLFNEDPAVVALVLARARFLDQARRDAHAKTADGATPRPRKALVASNCAGGLPLLETFSRNTAKELRNRGYETVTRFGSEVSKDDLRKLLPEQDIFLWEGHHNTLIKEYALHYWNEPLQPSLVFLQSCLALKDYKAQPLIERGALSVVGSSTRIYSASGGSFALAFFDAVLYEDRSLGSSLRQSKNFLLAYSLLKEKRLGKDARLTAANLRSAWAFTLWGDPTLKLPAPAAPADALPPVRHRVKGNTIHLLLPVEAHEKATTSKFKAQMLPNGRLAGLISKSDDDLQKLVPFVFAEVALPHAPAGQTPRLTSPLPPSRWVFCWDARRKTGYLLAMPRAKDREEIRFHVGWEPDATMVRTGTQATGTGSE